MKHKIISFLGVPGAGKTTAANLFKDDHNFTLAEENFGDNAFLDRYYENMQRWAFHSQMFFLVDKVKQLKATQQQLAKAHIVQDCPLLQDISYAKTTFELGKMSQPEWELYFQTYQLLSHSLVQPQVMFYLKVSPQTALERIRKRGRSYESSITADYLAAVQASIESLCADSSSSTQYIEIDAEAIDIATDEDDKEELRELVVEAV